MDIQTKMFLAAAFQIGVPIAISLAAAFQPSQRKWVVVVLGALTPLLLSFVNTSVRYLVFEEGEAGLAFQEMWLTSFLPYTACLVLGAALGFLKSPRTLSARYIVGLVPPSLVAVVLAFVLPQ